jgi:hypothetical protein
LSGDVLDAHNQTVDALRCAIRRKHLGWLIYAEQELPTMGYEHAPRPAGTSDAFHFRRLGR